MNQAAIHDCAALAVCGVRRGTRAGLRQAPLATVDRRRTHRMTLALLLFALVALPLAVLSVVEPAGRFLAMPDSSRAIVRSAGSRPADYLLVLNGRVESRAFSGAAAWHEGVAPRVLIAEVAMLPERPLRIHEWIADAMARHGVPRSAISFLPYPGGVANTRDEGRALRAFLEMNGAPRVVVVTANYHARRAQVILRQELRGMPIDLQVVGGPDVSGVQHDNWWKSGEGVRLYLGEYLKLAWALAPFRGGG
jgi:uncharacterized SAM-binding protein YcdF (DUF218 family)